MQAVDFDIHAGKDLDDEGFQLTHPDLNNTDNIIVKPSHYTQYKIEPVTFIMTNRLSFEVGNIVKYACRAGDKLYPGQDYTQSRITDLRKVMRYAEMEINRLEGKTCYEDFAHTCWFVVQHCSCSRPHRKGH